MNITATALKQLSELSSPTRGEFSIKKMNGENDYYVISVGKHSYSTLDFTEEVLFNALVCIRSCIAAEEGWYKK